MKKLLIVLLLPGILSCSKESEIMMSPLRVDGISGEALWERISDESPYIRYSYWPGHEGLRPGQSPHGPLHKIYVNGTLMKSLSTAPQRAPQGSIIVKENYTTEEVLDKITVMARLEGYGESGWFWAAYTPGGEVLAEGEPRGCVSCHAGMKDNDYIIVKPLRKGI